MQDDIVPFRRLGIISDCLHFKTQDGTATYNHVLLRQFEALACYFDSVLICCPFVEVDTTVGTYSAYTAKNIRFLPSINAGGNTVSAKLRLLSIIPSWIKLYKKVSADSDLVYLRFPNNISLPAFFYFLIKGKKSIATFTAPWDKDSYSSFSTNFQRWLLNHFFKGPVWVFSKEKLHKTRIIKSFSPSYSKTVWEEEVLFIEDKIANLKKTGLKRLNMVSVGSLDERKNHQYLLETCLTLKKSGIPFHLSIVGAGPLLAQLQQFIEENKLDKEVQLRGFLGYKDLRALFRESDFVVQSPLSEGYGKVPIEGFFHGLVPLLSNTSLLAKEITGNGTRGFVFDLSQRDGLFHKLQFILYSLSKDEIADMIRDGREYVKSFTIENWAADYLRTINSYFGTEAVK